MYNHPGHSLLNWPKTSTPSTNFCSFALRFLRKMVIPKARLLITIRTSQITQGVWVHLYFQVVYTSFPIFPSQSLIILPMQDFFVSTSILARWWGSWATKNSSSTPCTIPPGVRMINLSCVCLFCQGSNLEARSSGNVIFESIVLMEKIVRHLGCIKTCK